VSGKEQDDHVSAHVRRDVGSARAAEQAGEIGLESRVVEIDDKPRRLRGRRRAREQAEGEYRRQYEFHRSTSSEWPGTASEARVSDAVGGRVKRRRLASL
jgi:hypothetical protein